MNEKVERELQSIEEAISRLADHTRNLSSWADVSDELIEEMEQMVVALDHLRETFEAELPPETLADKPRSHR